ncbi:MAG: hypothetical protein O7C59_00810, partial [Rickettsia endosymbiont of Ixodes persulcatus]|nr:hypothetical protein [Rickettsia endosymbiont of Ixodes persulcatus]
KEDNSIAMYDYYGRIINKREFSSLTKSEWVGEVENFKRLEKPEKLKVAEETVYVLPSFGNLKRKTFKKKGVVSQPKQKKNEKVTSEDVNRSIDDIKKELECIQDIKEKQEKGTSLSVDELNKLLRESSLVSELKRLETK